MFLMRLSLAFGIPVRQLLKQMTFADLEEWMEFERIEPFGFLAEEARSARLRSQIRNMMASKEDLILETIDLMPNHPSLLSEKKKRAKEVSKPTQSVDQMKEMLKMLNRG